MNALRVSIQQSHSSGFGDSWGPARTCLFGPLVPGWKLANPLPVAIEREADGRVVFYDEMFNVYGTGDSWDAAERDYRVALVEYFEIMADNADDESHRALARLKAYIERC